jgi:hypothetical protein
VAPTSPVATEDKGRDLAATTKAALPPRGAIDYKTAAAIAVSRFLIAFQL